VCISLERVVCNKNLKSIGENAFVSCPKLLDFQFASSSIVFGSTPFGQCDHLAEIADAAGFPSTVEEDDYESDINWGEGVVPYLVDNITRSELRRYVLLASLRFNAAVHAHEGTELEKVAAAIRRLGRSIFSKTRLTTTGFLVCFLTGGGAKGVLNSILSFVYR